MRAYALAELGDPVALDVFLRREDAFAALEEVVDDEGETEGLLFVAPIDLDQGDFSLN